ncbi:uncharacterized protein METZ01_LOCUS232124 [marine metagenome]|uniref:Uncharacterized protein n=1 Tax=marine metagenome TaxID=408172 RepID=A0A382GW45_9ZZZZ
MSNIYRKKNGVYINEEEVLLKVKMI